jgi:hypothetical protein
VSLPPGMSDAQMGEAIVREIGRQAAFDLIVRLRDGRRDKFEVTIVRDQYGVSDVYVGEPAKRSSPRRQRQAPQKVLTTDRKTA